MEMQALVVWEEIDYRQYIKNVVSLAARPERLYAY